MPAKPEPQHHGSKTANKLAKQSQSDKCPRSYRRRRAAADRIAAAEPEHTATSAVVSRAASFQRQNQITQMYPLAVQFASGGLNRACARNMCVCCNFAIRVSSCFYRSLQKGLLFSHLSNSWLQINLIFTHAIIHTDGKKKREGIWLAWARGGGKQPLHMTLSHVEFQL